MIKFMRNLLASLIITVAAINSTAFATKAVKPNKFQMEQTKGYIVVKAGTDREKGKKISSCLYFARLDLNTNETVWNYGDSSPTSRKNLDVATATCGGNVWLKAEKSRKAGWYVIPVNPGRWVIAGGGDETSFSMGSYAFDVAPGKLTYIGEILVGKEDGKSDEPAIRRMKVSDDVLSFGTLYNILISHSFVLNQPITTENLPANLQSYDIVVPEFESNVVFNNAMRAMVSKAADLPD